MTSEELLQVRDAEIVQLKERIKELENGKFVVEKAAEYKERFDAYEAQVKRLSDALEELRRTTRERTFFLTNGLGSV